MELLTQVYDAVLSFFPEQYHWAVSLIILLLFMIVLFRFVRHTFLFIILLIVFVPASVPVIKNILSALLSWVQNQL